jgi:hypothetical protein
MALKQNYESTIGLSLREAYHKIIKVEIDYIADRATFFVEVFVDDKARADRKAPVFIKKIVIDKVGDMLEVRKKLYTYMKTLNDYSESVDV